MGKHLMPFFTVVFRQEGRGKGFFWLSADPGSFFKSKSFLRIQAGYKSFNHFTRKEWKGDRSFFFSFFPFCFFVLFLFFIVVDWMLPDCSPVVSMLLKGCALVVHHPWKRHRNIHFFHTCKQAVIVVNGNQACPR